MYMVIRLLKVTPTSQQVSQQVCQSQDWLFYFLNVPAEPCRCLTYWIDLLYLTTNLIYLFQIDPRPESDQSGMGFRWTKKEASFIFVCILHLKQAVQLDDYYMLMPIHNYSSHSILQPCILRPPLIIRLLDLVPTGNILC